MYETQRVKQLKANFIEYHENGYSIPEIANLFQVDVSHTYKLLQEIADANNCDRESLLEKPFSTRAHSFASYKRDKVSLEKTQSGFENLEREIKEIIAETNQMLNTEE